MSLQKKLSHIIVSFHFITVLLVLLVPFMSVGQRGNVKRRPKVPTEKENDIAQHENANDIVEYHGDYFTTIELRNFRRGAAIHTYQEPFIQIVINQIQEARTDGNNVVVEVVGWADGTPNHGISAGTLGLRGDCLQKYRDTVFDRELAYLRACEIYRLLSAGILTHSIVLSEKIDYHDIPDNVDTGGAYRKIVVKIFKYKNEKDIN